MRCRANVRLSSLRIFDCQSAKVDEEVRVWSAPAERSGDGALDSPLLLRQMIDPSRVAIPTTRDSATALQIKALPMKTRHGHR